MLRLASLTILLRRMLIPTERFNCTFRIARRTLSIRRLVWAYDRFTCMISQHRRKQVSAGMQGKIKKGKQAGPHSRRLQTLEARTRSRHI